MIHGVQLDVHRHDGEAVMPSITTISIDYTEGAADLELVLTDPHGVELRFAFHEFERAKTFVTKEAQLKRDIERNRPDRDDDPLFDY